MFVRSPTIVNMKYCLLLCGMLMSFCVFGQDMSEEDGAGTVLNKPAELSAKSSSEAVSETVLATYYARRFEGRKTTSGVRYRGKKMTAAHMTLPFGTIVTVTNPANGKSVDVEINDRGPHSRKFKIDLSEGAAKELGFYRKGVAKVEISYHPEAE